MQHIRILGKIETLIVSKKNYKLRDYKIAISSKPYLDDLQKPYESYSKPRVYGKKGDLSSKPFNFIAHCGWVHLDFESDNPIEDIKKIPSQLGRFKNEGMGKVRWEKYKTFKENNFDKIIIRTKTVKLKKLNCSDIDEALYGLLTAGLIHDLLLIPKKHPSKLGNIIINIQNKDVLWLVENHHNKIKDNNLIRLQRADRLASILTRTHLQPVQNQIGYGKPNLDKSELLDIVANIENKQDNFPELYDYIWNEKRLDNYVESQDYGLSSLRKHLLLTTQLIQLNS